VNIYDITLPITTNLANWTGDVPYSRTIQMEIANGDSVNLSSMEMSLHTGTHADAPFHYANDGQTLDQIDPSIYMGLAVVVDVFGYETIPLQALTPHLTKAPRLLLRTNAWQDHTRFPESIPVLAPEVPAVLGEKGIVLLGLDVPSVDALDSKTLPNHRALGRAGVHILESLDLRQVPEGLFELFALPLRLVGADGSPVRAVLRTIPL
jgi:arylformamidase